MFLAWRFAGSNGPGTSSESSNGLLAVNCNGKTVRVIPPADTFSVRMLIPESEVSTGADVRALTECYFEQHPDTTFITGAIGDAAFAAENTALTNIGNPDALSTEEQQLLETRTFTGQRNPDGYNIQLPASGQFAQ